MVALILANKKNYGFCLFHSVTLSSLSETAFLQVGRGHSMVQRSLVCSTTGRVPHILQLLTGKFGFISILIKGL